MIPEIARPRGSAFASSTGTATLRTGAAASELGWGWGDLGLHSFEKGQARAGGGVDTVVVLFECCVPAAAER